MTWKLAHNLEVRAAAVHSCYPSLTIYHLGDQAHLAEHSDHNMDARGIVHASDYMAAAGTATAKAILAWLLSAPADLEYVIHNHLIYERSNGFKPVAYTGSDPHTNHVHASSKHGSTGKNAATGTGYDTTAEASTPAGTPCGGEDMPLTKDDIHTLLTTPAFPYADPKVSLGTTWLATSTGVAQILAAVVKLADPAAVAAAIVAKLPTSGLTQAQITAGVKAALDDITLTVSADDTPTGP